MNVLAAATAQKPDYIALAMFAVLVIGFVGMYIRKCIICKKAEQTVAEPVAVAEVQKPTAPGSAGELKLYNVEPRTAAMLMAIVADKLGKPLNELRFISIKEVE